MNDILVDFLNIELDYQEFYDSIIEFVALGNIRYGEYECNMYIIKKLDRDNFVIYNENSPGHSIPINRSRLVKLINDKAKMNGLKIKNDPALNFS